MRSRLRDLGVPAVQARTFHAAALRQLHYFWPQAIGGAAGNMICVHNVVAASATVGLVDREGEIIRMTLIPMFYYIVQGGFIGLAILAGGLNLWWLAALVWPVIVLFLMSRNRGTVPVPQST